MNKIILFLGISIFFFIDLSAQDLDGSKDHPAISRYPGSTILYYYQKDYNEIQMPTAVVNSKAGKLIEAKGKHTSILYKGPKGRSTIEVFRNYENAIKNAGGEILFSCSGKYAPGGCDDYNEHFSLNFFGSVYSKRRTTDDQYLYSEGGSDDQAFLTAKFDRGNTITYIEIGISAAFFGEGPDIQLEVVEQSKMEDNLITVESIKEQLDKYGKVQIYTIFFATNSAQIEEGSAATLEAIGDYLKKYPKENLYVVGHTDDTGSFEYNLELSKKRAIAVTDALDTSAGRLQAEGVGPLCPEGSNQNDEGKTANRRVELVRRLK